MGGAALAELVPTRTANRPAINARATLFIPATFLLGPAGITRLQVAVITAPCAPLGRLLLQTAPAGSEAEGLPVTERHDAHPPYSFFRTRRAASSVTPAASICIAA